VAAVWDGEVDSTILETSAQPSRSKISPPLYPGTANSKKTRFWKMNGLTRAIRTKSRRKPADAFSAEEQQEMKNTIERLTHETKRLANVAIAQLAKELDIDVKALKKAESRGSSGIVRGDFAVAARL